MLTVLVPRCSSQLSAPPRAALPAWATLALPGDPARPLGLGDSPGAVCLCRPGSQQLAFAEHSLSNPDHLSV